VPPSAHDDESRFYLLGHLQDLLGPLSSAYGLGYLQVLLRDTAPVTLYFLDLLIEDYLCSLAQLLYHLWDPEVVGGVALVGRIAESDGYYMKLGVGCGSYVRGGGASQLGVLGAVSGQQDLGREDANRSTLHCRKRPSEVYVIIVSRELRSARRRSRCHAVAQGLHKLIHYPITCAADLESALGVGLDIPALAAHRVGTTWQADGYLANVVVVKLLDLLARVDPVCGFFEVARELLYRVLAGGPLWRADQSRRADSR
jgi:hypothetical protein